MAHMPISWGMDKKYGAETHHGLLLGNKNEYSTDTNTLVIYHLKSILETVAKPIFLKYTSVYVPLLLTNINQFPLST